MKKLICIFAAVFILVTHLTAEVIILKDGRKVEGFIKQTNENNLIIETSFGEVTLPKSKVEKIYYGDLESLQDDLDSIQPLALPGNETSPAQRMPDEQELLRTRIDDEFDKLELEFSEKRQDLQNQKQALEAELARRKNEIKERYENELENNRQNEAAEAVPFDSSQRLQEIEEEIAGLNYLIEVQQEKLIELEQKLAREKELIKDQLERMYSRENEKKQEQMSENGLTTASETGKNLDYQIFYDKFKRHRNTAIGFIIPGAILFTGTLIIGTPILAYAISQKVATSVWHSSYQYNPNHCTGVYFSHMLYDTINFLAQDVYLMSGVALYSIFLLTGFVFNIVAFINFGIAAYNYKKYKKLKKMAFSVGYHDGPALALTLNF